MPASFLAMYRLDTRIRRSAVTPRTPRSNSAWWTGAQGQDVGYLVGAFLAVPADVGRLDADGVTAERAVETAHRALVGVGAQDLLGETAAPQAQAGGPGRSRGSGPHMSGTLLAQSASRQKADLTVGKPMIATPPTASATATPMAAALNSTPRLASVASPIPMAAIAAPMPAVATATSRLASAATATPMSATPAPASAAPTSASRSVSMAAPTTTSATPTT